MTVKTLTESPPTLEEAQAYVGGLVELVRLADGGQMLVNEEGLLKLLPTNVDASWLAKRLIVGPALVLRGAARWE